MKTTIGEPSVAHLCRCHDREHLVGEVLHHVGDGVGEERGVAVVGVLDGLQGLQQVTHAEGACLAHWSAEGRV